MEILQAIRERKSIRAYKPDPVPKELLREILETAVRAPSSRNTQPWHITVATGKALDDIRQGNLEMLAVAAPGPERPLEGRYRERQMEQAQQLFGLLGIARDDKEKRDAWSKQGTRYFGAPAAIFISIDEVLGDRSPYFDCGMLTQTICLTALNKGLGTCIVGAGIRFPDVVRRVTGIPATERLIISICVGYPDWSQPVKKMERKRDPIDDTVRWSE
jgi:nitroreductase